MLSSIDPEKPVCEGKTPLPEEMAEEARDWWYYDGNSGKELLPEKVEKARRDEIDVVESMRVWEKTPRSQVPKGTKIIGTRWVDVNKQDETNPLYRSRLVAQEVKRGSGFDDFFAAMPSLAALKLLLTIAVSDSLPLEKGERRKTKQSFLGFLDVERDHFHSRGDDFTAVGSFEDIKWFHTSAAKEWQVVEVFSVRLDHQKPANRSEC